MCDCHTYIYMHMLLRMYMYMFIYVYVVCTYSCNVKLYMYDIDEIVILYRQMTFVGYMSNDNDERPLIHKYPRGCGTILLNHARASLCIGYLWRQRWKGYPSNRHMRFAQEAPERPYVLLHRANAKNI